MFNSGGGFGYSDVLEMPFNEYEKCGLLLNKKLKAQAKQKEDIVNVIANTIGA